jgi:hypothetical protein
VREKLFDDLLELRIQVHVASELRIVFGKARILANGFRVEKRRKKFFRAFFRSREKVFSCQRTISNDEPPCAKRERKKEEAPCASPEVFRRMPVYLSSTSSPTEIIR